MLGGRLLFIHLLYYLFYTTTNNKKVSYAAAAAAAENDDGKKTISLLLNSGRDLFRESRDENESLRRHSACADVEEESNNNYIHLKEEKEKNVL